MNLGGARSLTLKPESSVWYRAIQPQHQATALQTTQTKLFPSRFNAGTAAAVPFEILYLAEDPIVALFEVQAVMGSAYHGYVPQPAQSWIVLNVHVVLQKCANLCDANAQMIIQATAQELTGDWFGYGQRLKSLSLRFPVGRAPTQELGAAMKGVTAIEGFRTVSAKVPDKRILVVFPTNLRKGSSVEFKNDKGKVVHTISGKLP